MATTKTIAYAVMDRHWAGVPAHPEYGTGPMVPAVPAAFTEAERAWMERTGTVVRHRTYSLQQADFADAGFDLGPARPGSQTYAEVAGLEAVVCIATEDRYGILPPGTAVRRYPTIDAWRASADYPAEVVR